MRYVCNNETSESKDATFSTPTFHPSKIPIRAEPLMLDLEEDELSRIGMAPGTNLHKILGITDS